MARLGYGPGMVARFTAAAGLAVAVLAAACEVTDRNVVELSALSAPRAAEFARFERWVHRTLDGATALSGPDLFKEAAFSPIRNRTAVLAAIVDDRQRHGARLVFPRQARIPADIAWVSVRHRQAGKLHVARLPQCNLGLPAWWRKGVARRCVLISRESPRGMGRPLTITVAFGY